MSKAAMSTTKWRFVLEKSDVKERSDDQRVSYIYSAINTSVPKPQVIPGGLDE